MWIFLFGMYSVLEYPQKYRIKRYFKASHFLQVKLQSLQFLHQFVNFLLQKLRLLVHIMLFKEVF